jgi:hypothetical protein
MQDIQCNSGISLNALVHRIREKLVGEVLATLDGRLFDFGYIDIPDYDLPCFSVSQVKNYEVAEGFPRLTPENIPHGVSDVSYFIKFTSIENFLRKDFKLGSRI